MKKISKTIIKLIYNFCRELAFEYPKDTVHGTAYMMGIVPDDVSIDRSNGNYFFLYDKYYRLYYKVFAGLRGELFLEYLKDKELKDAFWHFTCEIIAGSQIYKDSKKLKQKVDTFLDSLSKPLEDYEVE